MRLRDILKARRHAARRRRVVIHIGTHKTGSTSIQSYLHSQRGALERGGIAFYRGVLTPSNHVELMLASQAERGGNMYAALHPEVDVAAAVERARERIRALLDRTDVDTFVFSAEGLSYLRDADELTRLQSFLGQNLECEVVLYLRRKADFLASYREQLSRARLPTSPHQGDFNYVEEDTWLLDYGALVDVYVAQFSRVQIMNYELECERHGGVATSFLEFLGAPPHVIEESDQYWLNRRDS